MGVWSFIADTGHFGTLDLFVDWARLNMAYSVQSFILYSEWILPV